MAVYEGLDYYDVNSFSAKHRSETRHIVAVVVGGVAGVVLPYLTTRLSLPVPGFVTGIWAQPVIFWPFILGVASLITGVYVIKRKYRLTLGLALATLGSVSVASSALKGFKVIT